MRRDELMKADLFSEIILLTSGVAILLTLVMAVMAAVMGAAAMQ